MKKIILCLLLFLLSFYYPNQVLCNFLHPETPGGTNGSGFVYMPSFNTETPIFPTLIFSMYPNNSCLIPHAGKNSKPLIITNPGYKARLKRGDILEIRWKGGDSSATYSLELYKGSILVKKIALVENTGEYRWLVPKNLKGSKIYQLKLMNSKFFGDHAFSQPFYLKIKLQQVIWIIPAVAALGGVYLLITNYLDNQPTDLPGPIEPY